MPGIKHKPKEIDVPAGHFKAVRGYREKLGLPDYVTDEMIYARLQDAAWGRRTDLDEEEKEDQIKLLIHQAKGYDKA